MNAEELLQRARSQSVMIATAESCTGGLLAGALTEIPGSSDVFDRGFVTYSNEAKTDLLGVNPDLIHTHGAVSEAVAKAMADGALKRSMANVAVSVTGVAGPGGTTEKPEGMVCFGIASTLGDSGLGHVETIQFGAIGRSAVRKASVNHAIGLLESTFLDW